MRIDVALTPSLIRRTESVFAVVDVLRASSTIVTLLERGATRVIPAASVDEARQLRDRLRGHLLCGEVNGLPPSDFDYGNSPVEFSALDAGGRPVILATSNGTRILNQLAEAPAVLVGSLLNREATARALIELARGRGVDATVVAAGAPSGALALEDALGAGAIVEAALRFDPSLEPTDSARFAREAFLTRSGDLAAALASARHGAELIEAGLAPDVEFCARLDVSSTVPSLARARDGLLELKLFASAG